jgi:hypothetical protein
MLELRKYIFFDTLPNRLNSRARFQFRNPGKVLMRIVNKIFSAQATHPVIGPERIQVIAPKQVGSAQHQKEEKSKIVFGVEQKPFLKKEFHPMRFIGTIKG